MNFQQDYFLFDSSSDSDSSTIEDYDSELYRREHQLGFPPWGISRSDYNILNSEIVRVDSFEPIPFSEQLPYLRENDPCVRKVIVSDDTPSVQRWTVDHWELIGRVLADNTHVDFLQIRDNSALNNDEKIAALFRGWRRSKTLKKLFLRCNMIHDVRSILPFVQSATELLELSLSDSHIESNGFHNLLSSLRDSSIEKLSCEQCVIDSIDSDIIFPKNLSFLDLARNEIGLEGVRSIAKLLRAEDPPLTYLYLNNNRIDDEGVSLLVDALRKNTSLTKISLYLNRDISKRGKMMLLKLVNDASSVKSTLQSNHTLQYIHLNKCSRLREEDIDEEKSIVAQILTATKINSDMKNDNEAKGREKLIKTQLHSSKRAKLAELQGVTQSLYSQIDSSHLPEVLSLVGRRHGQDELYVSLKESIAGVISIVNRKKCIELLVAEYEAKLKKLYTELAAIEGVEEESVGCQGDETRASKRRRK